MNDGSYRRFRSGEWYRTNGFVGFLQERHAWKTAHCTPVAVSATYIISGPFTFKVEPQIKCVHAGSGTHSTGGFMVNKCTWIINEVEGGVGARQLLSLTGSFEVWTVQTSSKVREGLESLALHDSTHVSRGHHPLPDVRQMLCQRGGRNGEKKRELKRLTWIWIK